MNDFTKKELQMILSDLEHAVFSRFYAEWKDKLREKIQSMIDNYCDHDAIQTIGTGCLLFHNKDSESAIISEIGKQLDLCANNDDSKCFRIDWKIIYGKKFGR